MQPQLLTGNQQVWYLNSRQKRSAAVRHQNVIFSDFFKTQTSGGCTNIAKVLRIIFAKFSYIALLGRTLALKFLKLTQPNGRVVSVFYNGKHQVQFQKQLVGVRLFISRLETDSFVFFSSQFIFLEYADSSNQRDFFLLGSLALRICPIKSVEYAWPQTAKKNFATRAKFFFFNALLFFSARLFLVY